MSEALSLKNPDAIKISKRPDGSFVLNDIYHVPDNEEYAALYAEVSAIAEEFPEKIEIIAPPSEEELLASARAAKLAELAAAFDHAEKNAVIESSAGFAINANKRANLDIAGLITHMEAMGLDKASFCAADNSFHEVTLDNLKTMRLEVIQHGQKLYAAKWRMRSEIEGAGSVHELAEVVVSFSGV